MPSLIATAGALALALLPHTTASHIALPARTTAPSFPLSQIYPLPTNGPALPALLVRDDDDDESTVDTVLVAPDSVCGYISGRPGAEFYCPASDQCILFTAKEDLPGNVACCNTDSCSAQITCMDYKDIVESSSCDDGCMVDSFTLKWYVQVLLPRSPRGTVHLPYPPTTYKRWGAPADPASTDSDLPYCNTVSFSSDIYDYACNNVDISTPQAVWTTYQGQTSGRTFTPLALDADETSAGESGFALPTGRDGEEEEEEEEGEGGDEEEGGGGGKGGGKKKGVNAGAIAGGVVGGVAVLGALILGILFLLRRKKSQPPPPATPATQQWTQPGSPQYASPGVPYFKPDQELPNYAQAALPPQQQQQQQGVSPASDQNSAVSPRESVGYYPGQFQQGVPVQGQQFQGQQPLQGQVHQGQQPPQGQAPQGQPMPELG